MHIVHINNSSKWWVKKFKDIDNQILEVSSFSMVVRALASLILS